ncbi:hypothetical protein UFOVP1247_27 [uncultured Caudovirales phage]|uniref:Uncharacterized protein n=1 Tax=uncultured Caudovirales phage TaxID=2100421 RepID=A0A6J5RMU7_9CAUD|nr:hypothetical protein UFOVP970_67 [uncultured Caudovirales phage]CAB4193144.1 hypothetical protein UFOVP1247_27 [uncultured Caudovirales phage]
MEYTDSERLDFLEKWQVSEYDNTRFTLLTQHVNKEDHLTLRSFCDHGIELEKMLDSNELDVMAWHYLPLHLQEIVINIWDSEKRNMSSEEKDSLQQVSNEYWETLSDSLEDK